jgi:hypothetical protein
MLEQTKIKPYLIDNSEVQLSTLTTTNANECFPSYSKYYQPIVKGRVRGIDIGLANLIHELTLTPLRSWQ